MTRQRNTISTFQMDGQANGFHYQLGYSYKYVLAEPGKYASFNVNEINAMLQYMWRKPHIGFNIFYKYTGPQPFLTTAITGDATYSGLQYAYHYCDASVEKKFFRKRLQVVAGVKNIFDITQLKTSGVISTGPHNSGVSGNFLPRSFFTSLRLSID